MATEAAVVQYLTTHEAAERLLISERAVRNAISRGELRAVKVCRRVRIAEEDYEAWIAAGLIEPAVRVELPPRVAPGRGLRGALQELSR